MKTAVKNKTWVTLRINIKMFNGDNLLRELLLTTRQKSKLRNAFENNMSIYIKLSKAQISKAIQSGGFLGSLLRILAGPLTKAAVPLAKKYFRSIRNNNCCFTNWCRYSKKKKQVVLEQQLVQAVEDSNILLKGVTKTI